MEENLKNKIESFVKNLQYTDTIYLFFFLALFDISTLIDNRSEVTAIYYSTISNKIFDNYYHAIKSNRNVASVISAQDRWYNLIYEYFLEEKNKNKDIKEKKQIIIEAIKDFFKKNKIFLQIMERLSQIDIVIYSQNYDYFIINNSLYGELFNSNNELNKIVRYKLVLFYDYMINLSCKKSIIIRENEIIKDLDFSDLKKGYSIRRKVKHGKDSSNELPDEISSTYDINQELIKMIPFNIWTELTILDLKNKVLPPWQHCLLISITKKVKQNLDLSPKQAYYGFLSLLLIYYSDCKYTFSEEIENKIIENVLIYKEKGLLKNDSIFHNSKEIDTINSSGEYAIDIQKVERKLNTTLSKSNKNYINEIESVCVIPVISKIYNEIKYWYGYQDYQMETLSNFENAYMAFFFKDRPDCLLLPKRLIDDYLGDLNYTNKKSGKYWHIHIFVKEDKVLWQVPKNGYIDVSEYLVF